MRLLLTKQDCVAQLEKKLDDVDGAEQSELFLGSMRRDRNGERTQVLRDLDKALAEYGTNKSIGRYALRI